MKFLRFFAFFRRTAFIAPRTEAGHSCPAPGGQECPPSEFGVRNAEAGHSCPAWMRAPGFLLGSLLVAGAPALLAQNAVNVTISAADTTLEVGETTTVTVLGQVASPQDGDSLRIFSWYVDVLTNPDDASIVNTNWNSLAMPESDSPDGSASTAGTGTTDANNNRRGVYNTFLNPTTSDTGISNPGIGAPVALITFDITATGPGTHTFTVAAGTTQPIANDFFVLRSGGAGAYTGGNYTAATLTITVNAPAEPDLEVLNFRISDFSGSNVTLSFTPQTGFNHTVESSQTLLPGSWTALPGGPHNGGTLVDNLGLLLFRFYRLNVVPAGP